MKFIELKKHLQSGALSPVYWLVGEDDRVAERARDMLLKKVDALPELNVTVFDENADISAVEACCRSFPLQAQYRAVIVRGYSGALDRMKHYFERPQASTILIFMSTEVTKNLSPYLKFINLVECGRLPRETLVAYIAKRAAKGGSTVTRPAAELLVDYTLGYLAAIENQVDKLTLITDAIREDDVRENVSASSEYKIFELSDAINKKDGKRAMTILRALLSDGYAPSAVLGMLEGQYRRMMYSVLNRGDENLAARLGVKEGAVYMAQKAAAGKKASALKRAYDIAAEYERAVKNGVMGDKDAVFSAVLQELQLQ